MTNLQEGTETLLKGCGRELMYFPFYCGGECKDKTIALCSECQVKIQERLKVLKEIRPILLKIQKVLNTYHSQFPMIEIGRENVLDDIDNEVDLDGIIKEISSSIEKLEKVNK